MKFAVLAASLLVVVYASNSSAIDTANGETKCSCEPGFNSKCTAGNDGDKHEVCPWTHECHESTNKTFSFCIPKGNVVCYTYQFLGKSGNIVYAQDHHPAKSCCDSSACTSRQTCVEINRGSDLFVYDYEIWNVADVARNAWKNKKGEAFQNKPKMCIDKSFDAVQGTKQVVAPAVSMVVIAIAIVLMFLKSQEGCGSKLLPLVVLVVSFFLTLSEAWIFALFTALVAVATVSTSTAHQGKLVLFLLAYVWLYFGGMNWLFAYTLGETPKNYFLHATAHSLPNLEGTCNAYFLNYFSTDQRGAWNSDETHTTQGLCGRGWISFLIIMAYLQAFALFLMVALKVLAFLGPAEPSSSRLGACLGRLPGFKGKGEVKPAKENY